MIRSSEYENRKHEIDEIVERYESDGYERNKSIFALENSNYVGIFKRPHSKDLDKFFKKTGNNQISFQVSVDLLRNCLIYPSTAEYDEVVKNDYGFVIGIATKLIEKLGLDEDTSEKKL